MLSVPFSIKAPSRSVNQALAALVVFLLSCAVLVSLPDAWAAGRRCVTDDSRNEICVQGTPRRVASLAPSLTEIMFALRSGDMLVGRTLRCNQPSEAAGIPDVGGYMTPDLERLMALRPDLVLSDRAGIRKEMVARLAALGIPVYVDDSRSLDAIGQLMATLGILLSREAEAAALLAEFDQRRSRIRDRVGKSRRPSVLFSVGSRPLVAAGGKSFIGSLIREAGADNIAEGESLPFPRFSVEEVIRKDPDYIMVLNKECQDAECLELWRRYPELKAVLNGRVFPMDADLLARPSPRIVDGLEQMAAIFHPNP